MHSSDHPASWYAASANRQLDFAPLTGEADADVCIIGGGYTGLSAALHLRQRGYDAILLEANRVGWGASGRNGGQVGTGQRLTQQRLEKLLGPEQAKALWQLALEAVATVVELITEYGIDCDLRRGILHVAAHHSAVEPMRRDVAHLNSAYDYPDVRFVARDELSQMLSARGLYGGVLDTGGRHLHPLNYALGLAAAAAAQGARLHEHSRALGWKEAGGRVQLRTARGIVRARYLVIACNGYLERLAPLAARRIMPINNFMLATAPLPESLARRVLRDDVAVADSRFVVNYWRLSADRRLLFGGGETYGHRFPADIKALVRRPMLRLYPELADVPIDYGWGGTLAITRNRLPDFGRLAANVFYAQGYSGHGVSLATLAGKLLAEVVAGSAERFDVMAAIPSPAFPGGTLLRYPALVAGMLYYSLRDRLG